MAYPTITYNQSTGSNTAPSDAVATSASTSTTVSGTSGTNTITFSSAVDLTGVADDDSDYIWVNNAGSDRSIYQITAFTGGVSTCTAVTVYENIDGTGVSAVDWHVNGTRNDIVADNDGYDWMPGWTISLNGDQTRSGSNFRVGNNHGSSGDAIVTAMPPVTIEPSSSGRVSIVNNGTAGEAFRLSAHLHVKIERVDFSSPSYTNGATPFNLVAGNTDMFDCSIDVPSTSFSPLVNSEDSVSLVKTYMRGGGALIVDGDGSDIAMMNCWIDCQGTYGTTAAVKIQANDSALLINTAITESAGSGLLMDRGGNVGRHVDQMVRNCTIADSAGDAITVSGTPNSTTSPTWNVFILNNLLASSGGYGINSSGQGIEYCGYIGFNGFYSNTSGNYSETALAHSDDVTCSASPFTDAANDDYTINDTAGGGADLKAAGLNAMPDRP